MYFCNSNVKSKQLFMLEKIKHTASFIQKETNFKPLVGIILGSGLGNLADSINVKHIIDYKQIPNFPVSTVEGHKGRLIFGELGGKNVVAMQGRFHFYEGYSMEEVTFPVRVMKMLGIKYLFVSNAAGGLNTDFSVGDIMIIRDHINFFHQNPLIGKNYDELGPRFPDMGKAYNPELIDRALEIAQKRDISVQTGVYIGSTGPTLETPAEYKFFRTIGADATGMSTVPEIIVAHHMGLICFGLSIITNVSNKTNPDIITTHEEVQNVAGISEPKMTAIIKDLMATL